MQSTSFNDNDAFTFTAIGKSNSKYDWIFKVRDRYESVVDAKTLLPYQFTRQINEGSFHKKEMVKFNQKARTASTEAEVYKTSECTFDVVSAIYAARNFNYSNLAINDKIYLNFFLDNFVTAFSQQLPIFTLSEILGIPEADRPKLVTWMEFLELAQYIQVEQMKKEFDAEQTNEPVNTDMIDMFNSMVDEMFEYGRDILNAKRKNPGDDLLSAIANAELEGHQLSPEFLDGSWLLIIFAGNDTTIVVGEQIQFNALTSREYRETS